MFASQYLKFDTLQPSPARFEIFSSGILQNQSLQLHYKFAAKRSNLYQLHHIFSMWRFLADAAKFVGLLHFTHSYLFSPSIVHGRSMLPTFNPSGDVVLAEHFSHRLGRLVPGDVVFVRSPDDPNRIVGKRVLGLEGDKVEFLDPHRILFQHGKTVVPKGHVWIQGDNTYESHDSRSHGPVPYGLIEGRVFFRVWPLDGFGFVRDRVAEDSGPVPTGGCSTDCLWDFRRPLGFDFRDI